MYQLKQVTIAILNYVSFHSLCWIMNRIVKTFKQKLFYWNNKMFCGYQKLQCVFKCCLSAVTQAYHHFVTRLLPCQLHMLLEFSGEVCCSGVWNLYCCYIYVRWYFFAKGRASMPRCKASCHWCLGRFIKQYEVGTLAIDGWAVIFGTARRRGLGGLQPRPVPSSLYQM